MKKFKDYLKEAMSPEEKAEQKADSTLVKKEMKKMFGTMKVRTIKSVRGDALEFRGDFPNVFRLQAVNVIAPNANIQDRENVNYGNIHSDRIAMSIKQWKLVLGL